MSTNKPSIGSVVLELDYDFKKIVNFQFLCIKNRSRYVKHYDENVSAQHWNEEHQGNGSVYQYFRLILGYRYIFLPFIMLSFLLFNTQNDCQLF